MSTVTPNPYAPERVRGGTAENLARLAHVSGLHSARSHISTELDEVAWFLIGAVEKPRSLWDELRDPADLLFHVQAGEWLDSDLDEVPEADWRRFDFATGQQELAHRVMVTRERLTHDIESAIAVARLCAAERRRVETERRIAVVS